MLGFCEFSIFHPSKNHFWAFDVKANVHLLCWNHQPWKCAKSAVSRKTFFSAILHEISLLEVIYAWTWTWFSFDKHWKTFFWSCLFSKICFAATSTKVLKKAKTASHTNSKSKRKKHRFRGQEKTSSYRWKAKLKAVEVRSSKIIDNITNVKARKSQSILFLHTLCLELELDKSSVFVLSALFNKNSTPTRARRDLTVFRSVTKTFFFDAQQENDHNPIAFH